MGKLSDAIKALADTPAEPVAEVASPTYRGVSVEHSSIVSTVRNMAKQGKKVQEIMRVVGVPAEVVRRHAPDAKSD